MTDHVHYLPDDLDAGRWGLRLSAGGTACIAPGQTYPVVGHPESHLFRWERGRVLREFQLVLVAAGGGHFEDQDGTRQLVAGQAFLLVPGRWHRYRPDPTTGWEERWLAFDGPAIRRLHQQSLLDPASPAWQRPIAATLRGRIDEVLALLHRRPAAWRPEAEGITAAILARITAPANDGDDPLRVAASRLAGDLHLPIKVLAKEACLSTSQFRQRFRQLHGCSPRRYRQDALVARAQRLLAMPGTTVSEVAEALGFSDHPHFTRGFRRACGESPRTWRKRMDRL
jgi:AraC-like DNA-binding protein